MSTTVTSSADRVGMQDVPVEIVDTDVHQVLDARRMPDFLPEPWRSRFAAGSRGPGHLGYWNPNGVMRSDTVLPDGSRIEGSPENLARHFFDPYVMVPRQRRETLRPVRPSRT